MTNSGSSDFPENNPQRPENRPGLEQLAYRIGDYGTARQRLLARLPKMFQFPRPESSEASLSTLTTRSDDDFAISLLDAWAIVTDVLTFYQERIANEGYLLTATERRSVLELARSIGYELDPGVAASTHLSFTVEDAPGSPTEVVVPKGTQIMSVPEKDELPQTFETLKDFTAYVAWNAIKPRPHRPQIIDETTDQLYLEGTNTQLKQEDLLLIVDRIPEPVPYVVQLTEVIADSDADHTLVRWQRSSPKQQSWNKIEGLLQNPQVLTFRQTAHLFGYNAPDWEIMPAETKLAAIEESGDAIQGGVFRSASDGIIWAATSQGLPNQDIVCIATKQGPDSHPMIFAGTAEKGIFRSTDNGQTWKTVNTGITNQNIQTLHVDSAGDPIYAGTPAGGVFRSKDNGDTWVAINTGSVKVEGTTDTDWQSINTSIPDTVVRSLLAYNYKTHKGLGSIRSKSPEKAEIIIGNNTDFTAEIVEGNFIAIDLAGDSKVKVSSVQSATELELEGPFGFLPKGSTYDAIASVNSWLTIGDILNQLETAIQRIVDTISPNLETIKNRAEDFIRSNLPEDIEIPSWSPASSFSSTIENIITAGLSTFSNNRLVGITTTIKIGPSTANTAEISNRIFGNEGNLFSLLANTKLSSGSDPLPLLSSISINGNEIEIPGFEFIKVALENSTLEATVTDGTSQLFFAIGNQAFRSVSSSVGDRFTLEESGPALQIPILPFEIKLRHIATSQLNVSTGSQQLFDRLIVTFEEVTELAQTFALFSGFSIPMLGTQISRDVRVISVEANSTESLPEDADSSISSMGNQVLGAGTTFKWLDPTGNPYVLPNQSAWKAEIRSSAEGGYREIESIEDDENLTLKTSFQTNLDQETDYFIFEQNEQGDIVEKQKAQKFIFAGTDDGLYHSMDYGQNWYPQGETDDIRNKAVYSLAYSTDNPEDFTTYNLFAGTDSGLYHSGDHGNGWEQLTWTDTSLSGKTIFSLLTHQNSVFVGTNSGLYLFSIDTDETNNFTFTASGLTFEDTIIHSLAVYERPSVAYVFAATSQGLKKNDRSLIGDSSFVQSEWEDLNPGVLPQLEFIAVAADSTAALYVGSKFAGFLADETESVADAPDTVTVANPAKLEWPNFKVQNPHQLDLDTLYPRILPESWVLLASDRNPNNPEQETDLQVSAHQIDDVAAIDRRDFGLSGKITRAALTNNILAADNFGLRSSNVFIQSEVLPLADEPLTVLERKQDIFQDPMGEDTVFLETLIPKLQVDQPVIVSGRHLRARLADVGGISRSQFDWSSIQKTIRNPVINVLTYAESDQRQLQFVGTDEGLYQWQQTDESWIPVTDLDYKVIHSIWQNNNHLFVGADQTLYRSEDDGVSWHILSGLPTISTQTILGYEVPGENLDIKITAISGVTLTLSESATDYQLAEGDVITVNGHGRIITKLDNDDPQTLIINAVFDSPVPLEEDAESPTNMSISFNKGGRLLWAGTDQGIYRSTDAGVTWQQMSDLQTAKIYDLSIVIIQSSGQPTICRLLAATDQGLHQSIDNGENWNLALPGEILSLHPRKPEPREETIQIWAGTAEGLYRFENKADGSVNWEKIEGLKHRQILSLAQRQDQILFAGTDQGIYRSQNSGNTWQSIDAGLEASAGRTLAMVEQKLIVGTEQGLFETPNNGDVQAPLVWGRSHNGLDNSQVLSLAVSTSGTEMIAGTTAGVFHSTNAGRSWTPESDGLNSTTTPDPLAISSILFAFNHWYVGTPEGLFCSQPDTIQWQEQHTGLAYKDIRALAIAPGGFLWVGTQSGGLLRFTPDAIDNTSGTWAQTSLNNVAVQAIAVGDSLIEDPRQSNVFTRQSNIFVGTQQNGLYHSSNNGVTWDAINETRGGRGTISTKGVEVTLVGATFEDILQAGDVINVGGQSRTIVSAPAEGSNRFLLDLPFKPDLLANTTFTINTGLTNRQITAVAIATNTNDNTIETVYVGTAGSGVFRSTDIGKRWEQVIINLDDLEIRCLLIDTNQDLWAGTAQRGIFRSINGGDLWAPVNTDLTNTDIRFIVRPNESSPLIVGGIGILIAEDGLKTTPVQRDDIAHVLTTPQKIQVSNQELVDELNQQSDELLTHYWRWTIRDKDGNQGIFDTPYKQPFPLLPANPDDAPISERAIIQVPPKDQKRPVMIFKESLKYSYDPTTVEIYANVVEATHGETEEEVLGSGDGNASFQEFVLKKPPLTYVPASNASGSESALAVRVDGVLWQEVPSLYPLKSQDQSYIIRIEDDGTTRIGFGDGIRGARLPSGQENIMATYRSGIGTQANVAAGQLSILKTRPQGITDVLNPLPATGATNPERLEDARVKAPPTVRTLDRIVSLQDFEDFAQGFAGIGKAQAAAIWNGVTEVVYITLAGIQGATVPEESLLYRQLFQAIEQSRDPMQQVILASYDQQLFNVEARVLIDPRYETEPVLAAANIALQTKFQFDTQAFGQAVTSSAVIAVIQSIDGIVAVDLDALYRVGESRELASTLTAATARYDQVSRQLKPAQLLLINGIGVQLSEVASL